VQETFQEGKKIWSKLSENSGDMMPIADIFEKKDLVLNVKKVDLS
jgi:hypothetical protein